MNFIFSNKKDVRNYILNRDLSRNAVFEFGKSIYNIETSKNKLNEFEIS